MTNIESHIRQYFSVLDQSLETLSHHHEGKISRLPSWVLTTRNIDIGITTDFKGMVFKADPDKSLDQDQVNLHTIKNIEDINKLISPLSYGLPFPNEMQGIVGFSDIRIENQNPLKPPGVNFPFLVGAGLVEKFLQQFSNVDDVKAEAIDIWNSTEAGTGRSQSFVHEARNVFEKFEAIIKRKSFLERRIHRYINDHAPLLLPSHTRCLFEHRLFYGGEERKADFILEREQGLPAILIELESPVHKVFTRRHDFTKEVNHAKAQISEWVSFIAKDSVRNASGETSFLTGPKEQIVIIGRGLDERERLIDSQFGGVTVWTYDLFLEEAKTRLNDHLASQYRLLGLEEIRLF